MVAQSIRHRPDCPLCVRGACNGVCVLPPEKMAAFDADLAALLAAEYPEPLSVAHRIYGIVARTA